MIEDKGRETFSPQRLLAALGHAVVATDAAGIVRYWNDAASRLYGWTAAEAIGVHLHKLIGAGTPRSFAVEVMAVVRAGGRWSGGLPARSKSGSVFPVLVTNSAIHDDQGRLVGLVTASVDLGSAVRPVLARFGGATLLVDAAATVRFASPVTTDLLGWHESELLGTSVLDLVHPDDLEQIHPWFESGRVGREVVGREPELRMRTRDGRWCWVIVRSADLYDDPAVSGLVVTLRDVTASRQALEDQRELTGQLQTALDTRVVVEQAKGAIAVRLGLDLEQAFEWLRAQAREGQRRIDEVAAEVVAGLGPIGDQPRPAGERLKPAGDGPGPVGDAT